MIIVRLGVAMTGRMRRELSIAQAQLALKHRWVANRKKERSWRSATWRGGVSQTAGAWWREGAGTASNRWTFVALIGCRRLRLVLFEKLRVMMNIWSSHLTSGEWVGWSGNPTQKKDMKSPLVFMVCGKRVGCQAVIRSPSRHLFPADESIFRTVYILWSTMADTAMYVTNYCHVPCSCPKFAPCPVLCALNIRDTSVDKWVRCKMDAWGFGSRQGRVFLSSPSVSDYPHWIGR